MAYVSQEMKAKLAPTIKAICKKYGVSASISVHNHSTLVLTIRSSKIDFIGNYNETVEQRAYGREVRKATDHLQVNTYYTDEHFTGDAKNFFNEMIPAMKGPDFFDHSDSQTDYFHCSHYIDINVGRWDKPFIHNPA